MLSDMMQPPMLYMLHAQHRYYTSELGSTHRQLGRQYNKLAAIELELIQRHEKNLTRQDKKRLQWSRSLTKGLVKSLESQQTWLHDYLRQCNDLIASCEGSMYSSPVTPWSAFPPTDPFSPMSGLSTPTPWSAAPMTPFQPQYQQGPQYWDLSMLRERRESSPFTPSWSADSGFYETNTSALPHPHGFSNPFNHNTELENPIIAASPSPPSKKSSISEKDDVPELIEPVSPTKSGASASSPRKRRYSENAIQLIENSTVATKADAASTWQQCVRDTCTASDTLGAHGHGLSR